MSKRKKSFEFEFWLCFCPLASSVPLHLKKTKLFKIDGLFKTDYL